MTSIRLEQPKEETYEISSYISPFNEWNSKASVRSRPQRHFIKNDCHYLFSPSLFPIIKNSKICSGGEEVKKILLAQKLYSYLSFTDQLEIEIVLPACYNIINLKNNIEFEPSITHDARLIATDEAYHAFFCNLFLQEICTEINIKPINYKKPIFINSVNSLLSKESDLYYKDIIRIFCAFISETLITNTLSQIPKDSSVIQSVRELVKDHADDEFRHHRFFSFIIKVIWPHISYEKQCLIGCSIPQLIIDYLYPDTSQIVEWIVSIGFSIEEANLIIGDTFKHKDILSYIKEAARPTLHHLRVCGFLENPIIYQSFNDYGLV
ncbi:MAG: diiron oxygenase [Candidatus Saccharimonadales bacterium]